MATNTINIGIIGASGYGAGELLRLLANHKEARVVSLASSSSDGKSIAELHPNLHGLYSSLNCSKELDLNQLSSEPSVIFSALPHGVSGNQILALAADPKLAKCKFIDLSGDLRLKEPALAEKWYAETKISPELRNKITYGLPELHRSAITKAQIIANPGCLSSAAILALAPLKDSLRGEVIIDAKTGTSGAGRTPQPAFHHPSMHGSCNAYKVLEHRHEAEIREVLGDPFEKNFQTTFVPHVIPTSRGIYVSCYLNCDPALTLDKLFEKYRTFYQSSPSVIITEQIPELRSVIGSNYCQISLRKRGTRTVVFAALDNMVRGMAGSAIQNMNIALGLDEMNGLTTPGLGVI